jgi:hypothetical protein
MQPFTDCAIGWHCRTGLVEEYLLQAAHRSQLLAHQMIWCGNTYSNESPTVAFPIADRASFIKQAIIDSFDDVARVNYEIEFSFIEEVCLSPSRVQPQATGLVL